MWQIEAKVQYAGLNFDMLYFWWNFVPPYAPNRRRREFALHVFYLNWHILVYFTYYVGGGSGCTCPQIWPLLRVSFLVIFECATKLQGSTGKILLWREYIPLTYVSDDSIPNPHFLPKIFQGGRIWKIWSPIAKNYANKFWLFLAYSRHLWPPTIPEIFTKIRPLRIAQTGVERRYNSHLQMCAAATCGALWRANCETSVGSSYARYFYDYHSAQWPQCGAKLAIFANFPSPCRPTAKRGTPSESLWHLCRNSLSHFFHCLLLSLKL